MYVSLENWSLLQSYETVSEGTLVENASSSASSLVNPCHSEASIVCLVGRSRSLEANLKNDSRLWTLKITIDNHQHHKQNIKTYRASNGKWFPF